MTPTIANHLFISHLCMAHFRHIRVIIYGWYTRILRPRRVISEMSHLWKAPQHWQSPSTAPQDSPPCLQLRSFRSRISFRSKRMNQHRGAKRRRSSEARKRWECSVQEERVLRVWPIRPRVRRKLQGERQIRRNRTGAERRHEEWYAVEFCTRTVSADSLIEPGYLGAEKLTSLIWTEWTKSVPGLGRVQSNVMDWAGPT